MGEGHLFVFMEPTSPKGKDLQHDARYALHCAVADSHGTGGEFSVTGRATRVSDAGTREVARRIASYSPRDRYILFELSVETASSTVYQGDEIIRRRWTAT